MRGAWWLLLLVWCVIGEEEDDEFVLPSIKPHIPEAESLQGFPQVGETRRPNHGLVWYMRRLADHHEVTPSEDTTPESMAAYTADLRRCADEIESQQHAVFTEQAIRRICDPLGSMAAYNVTIYFKVLIRHTRRINDPDAETLRLRLIDEGHPVTIQQYPFMVKVVSGEKTSQQCNGVLLSLQWVLTSGCAHSFVRAGATDLATGDGVTVAVAEEHRHPSFEWRGYTSRWDLRLLKLREPLVESHTVKPIDGLVDDIDSGADLTTVGWGEILWPERFPKSHIRTAPHGQLHTNNVSVVAMEDPRISKWGYRALGRDVFFTEGGVLCHSDLGSPLLATRADGTVRLFGVASTMVDEPGGYPYGCDENTTIKWTRVHEARQWLHSMVPELRPPHKTTLEYELCTGENAIPLQGGTLTTGADTTGRVELRTCSGGASPSTVFMWSPGDDTGLYTIDTIAVGTTATLISPIVGVYVDCVQVRCSTPLQDVLWLDFDAAAMDPTPYSALDIAVLRPNQTLVLQVSGGNPDMVGSFYLRITRRRELPPPPDEDVSALRPSPVVWYSFEGVVRNVVGTDNPRATMVGSELYTSPSVCASSLTTKVGTFAVVSSGVPFASLSDFTLEVWLKVIDTTHTGTLLHSGDGIGSVVVDFPSGGGIRYKADMGGMWHFTVQTFQYTLPIDTWLQLVITQKGNDVTIFVDGHVVAMGVAPFHPNSFDHTSMYIGARRGGDTFFAGDLDEMLFYNIPVEPVTIQHWRATPPCKR